jgi:hypothetical protein
MVHTKDGSRAVREFIARGAAKVSYLFVPSIVAPTKFHNQDRKQIIKVLKPHVEKMCADEEAQLVLFTIFDLVEYVIPSKFDSAVPNFSLLTRYFQRHQISRQIPRCRMLSRVDTLMSFSNTHLFSQHRTSLLSLRLSPVPLHGVCCSIYSSHDPLGTSLPPCSVR